MLIYTYLYIYHILPFCLQYVVAIHCEPKSMPSPSLGGVGYVGLGCSSSFCVSIASLSVVATSSIELDIEVYEYYFRAVSLFSSCLIFLSLLRSSDTWYVCSLDC